MRLNLRGNQNRRRGVPWNVLLLLPILLLCFLIVVPASAQAASAYAWAEANVALVYPAGFDTPVASVDGDTQILNIARADNAAIQVAVLPAAAGDVLRSALDAQLTALNLLPLRYDFDTLYGRGGLRADAVSADRAQVGVARAGLLPDNRVLVVAGHYPAADGAVLTADLDTLLNSLVLSADLPPVAPGYHPVWSTLADDARVFSMVVAGGQLYAVDETGVRLIDPNTGGLIASYPFDRPAQPSGIGVDAQGAIYVSDTVCRCLRMFDGRWRDPIGSFGGGAPFSFALAPDATLYAVDKSEGYTLRILGEPRNRTLDLNFNASAPPLLALDGAGQLWMIEWLNSLIDGSTSGAVSLVDPAAPAATLQYWLEGLSPQTVSALAADAQGDLAIATSDGVVLVDSAGQIIERIDQEARALAFGADGTLYIARPDGSLSALSRGGAADRFGASTLALGVPVQGVLSETAPAQSWTYEGAVGERVTISAVDQTRTDAFVVGLDMALRLTAPDGSELEYNDDQRGADLFSAFDAQIADLVLPQSGTYTVSVEWRQGSGMYTLGVSSPRSIPLSADGVTRVEGSLQDVFPVQRWAFEAHAGDVLTFTMSAESGTLDPALALRQPDGSLLAYNDDAVDLELGDNAQIAQVRLPVSGTYFVDASRFEGVGRYSLVIVNIT